MVCAAYAANVLENALTTLGHEARERAFAQVDELLAEYSQWPFAKRQGGSQGVGANLGQLITDEVNGSKDKELQLEVSRLHFDSKYDDRALMIEQQVVAACLSVFTRLDSLL
jgi:Golgi phosphoprotein 3